MLSFNFKCLCISVVLIVLFNNAAAQTSEEYINYKLKETNELLARVYEEYLEKLAAIVEDSDNYITDWVKLWNKTSKAVQPRTINFFNQTFLVDDDDESRVLFSRTKNDFTTQINQLQFSSQQDPIKFTAYTSWKELPFLLVCRAKYCLHYEGSQVQNYQRLESDGLVPENACFFTRGEQLYLIITFTIEKYPTSHASPSKIYAWSGSEMIQIDEMLTPPVKTLITFQEDESIIIILALKNNAYEGNDYCYVYEFKDDNQAEYLASLTNTGPIAYIYPYTYDQEEFAILISNNQDSSGIFWWDETTLRKWISIPDVTSSSLVNVIHTKNDTLLFVTNVNVLHVYKITGHDCIKLDEFSLKVGQQIVEICAWEEKNSIMLLLVIADSNENVYQTQMWRVDLHKRTEIQESDEVWVCFDKLRTEIQSKKRNLKNKKLKYFSTANNRLFDENQKNNTPLLEFDDESSYKISIPMDIKNQLIGLDKIMKDLDSSIKKAPEETKSIKLTGNTVVSQDVRIDELYIDEMHVDYLNGEKLVMDDIVVSKIDQNFSVPLRVPNIFIDNLEVPVLCGLKASNWLMINDTEKIPLSEINFDKSRIQNDTIVIDDSSVELKNLNPKIINSIDIKSFLDDIFIQGKNQIIRGNVTYPTIVRVKNLTTDRVNNVSASQLITKFTKQHLGTVIFDRLDVKHLYVETINGVRVDKAARMSQENIIHGKVTIGNFIITKELEVERDVALSLAYPTQVYDAVTIYGHAFVQNLEMDNQAPLILHSAENINYNIQDILRNSWSKSRNQTIKGSVVFEKGASIDELNSEYINGLREQDFIYTDTTELLNLKNVTFSDFHFNKVLNEDVVTSKGIIEETDDLVTFLGPVRINHLEVDNVIASYYNGIPIETIMTSTQKPFKFDGVTEFETVYVNNLTVNELEMNHLESLDVSYIMTHALKVNQSLKLKSLVADSVNMRNLVIKKLNGHDFEEAMLAQERFDLDYDQISLTVDGDIKIEDNLMVAEVNDINIVDYLEFMKEHLVDTIDAENWKNMRVLHNLTVRTLNGLEVEDHFDLALSKTKEQTITGNVTLIDTYVNKLKSEVINDKRVSELVYIDEPVIFRGNVMFDRLQVKAPVKTRTVNRETITKLKKDLETLPLKNCDNMYVMGNLYWDEDSDEPSDTSTLSYLLNNAVTKHENQTINSSVTFGQAITIGSLYLEDKDSTILSSVRDIMANAVVDDPDSSPVTIKGTKIFKKGVLADDLEVTGNLLIDKINGINVEEAVSKIFLKNENHSVTSELVFMEPVKIGRLITNRNIHGVSYDDLAQVHEKMPDYMHFRNLVVEGNVDLFKLDGVQFDEFKKKRMTLDGNHEINVDLHFEGSIVVKNRSYVSDLNGMRLENLILNQDSDSKKHKPVLIKGRKTFASDLVVDGNVELGYINDLNLKEKMNGLFIDVKNGVKLHGDLTFEESVETHGDIHVSGLINGMSTESMMNKSKETVEKAVRDVDEAGTSLVLAEHRMSMKLKGVQNHLLYLEEDVSIKFNFSGVQSIHSFSVNTTTRLDVYGLAPPSFCSLPEGCTCRKQHVVEISPTGEYTIYPNDDSTITFNFFKLDNLSKQFKLTILNRAISYSRECFQLLGEPQRSQIFWIQNDREAVKPVIELGGFISDAEIFRIDDKNYSDKVYLILSIYYNETTKSHSTNSLVYEFDMQSNAINLVQEISTVGARKLHVFENNDEVYILISCVRGKAETLLLKFEPKMRKFKHVQTFATRGSQLITSVNIDKKSYIILNNPDIDTLQIYMYDFYADRYYDYQNLNFDSKVISLSVLYAGESEKSEAFIVISTRDGWLYIYEFMYFGKFQLKTSYWSTEIQTLSTFRHLKQNYLLASSISNSQVYKVIQQGVD